MAKPIVKLDVKRMNVSASTGPISKISAAVGPSPVRPERTKYDANNVPNNIISAPRKVQNPKIFRLFSSVEYSNGTLLLTLPIISHLLLYHIFFRLIQLLLYGYGSHGRLLENGNPYKLKYRLS